MAQLKLERRTRSRKVAGSRLHELQCCQVAADSLIRKSEYLIGSDDYVFE